jgi:hypothetical protein
MAHSRRAGGSATCYNFRIDSPSTEKGRSRALLLVGRRYGSAVKASKIGCNARSEMKDNLNGQGPCCAEFLAHEACMRSWWLWTTCVQSEQADEVRGKHGKVQRAKKSKNNDDDRGLWFVSSAGAVRKDSRTSTTLV